MESLERVKQSKSDRDFFFFFNREAEEVVLPSQGAYWVHQSPREPNPIFGPQCQAVIFCLFLLTLNSQLSWLTGQKKRRKKVTNLITCVFHCFVCFCLLLLFLGGGGGGGGGGVVVFHSFLFSPTIPLFSYLFKDRRYFAVDGCCFLGFFLYFKIQGLQQYWHYWVSLTWMFNQMVIVIRDSRSMIHRPPSLLWPHGYKWV